LSSGGFFRSTSIVGGLTLLSRVTGLLRDMVYSRMFGAGVLMDAFLVAFKIPNFMRRLFAEGAFSQAFVPVLSEYHRQRGAEATRDLVGKVGSLLAIVLLGVTALGVLASPWLVYLLASGSVARLGRLQGGTGQVDRRRFRPNLYIDTGDSGPEGDRFVEDDWLGATMTVGQTLVLDDLQPTLWCVTSTLAQEELPYDRSALRATAHFHGGCLGVYASVRSPGRVRVGDPVVLS